MDERIKSLYQKNVEDKCLEGLYNNCINREVSISDVLDDYAQRVSNLELVTLNYKDNYSKLLFMAYEGTCKQFNFEYKLR